MNLRLDELEDLLVHYQDGNLLALSDIDDTVQSIIVGIGKNFPDDNVSRLLSLLKAQVNAAFTADGRFDLTQSLQVLAELKTVTGASGDAARAEEEQAESLSFFAGLIETFLVDADERISRAQELTLEIELKGPESESINELFRVFHTIKGECGMLKIASLGEIAHAVEGLLSMVRDSTLPFDSTLTEIVLEGIDHAKTIIGELKNGKAVIFGASDLGDFVGRTSALSAQARPSIGEVLVSQGSLSESERLKILSLQKESAFTRRFGEIAIDEEAIDSSDLVNALENQRLGPSRLQTESGNPGQNEGRQSAVNFGGKTSTGGRGRHGNSLIKVRAEKVNFLADMIGELTIAIGQLRVSSEEISHVKKIVRGLQHSAMELRTDSARVLFGTMRRAIRDLARSLGKSVEIELIGEDLEIDRQLMENMEEPLMHLVRNALDHGIEAPEERERSGKSRSALVKLSAQRKGNSIVVSVADDGRGLDREKILAKAVEKGLADPENSRSWNDNVVFDLIFHTGFSTADSVSLVSGRGMGMDIVKSFVLSYRGRIEITTTKGRGTRFDLVFPLNAAIMDGMVVTAAGRFFILPISVVSETMRLSTGARTTIGASTELIDLRGLSLPLVDLSNAIGAPSREKNLEVGIVIETGGIKRFVLAVDSVIAKQEIVIKPLGVLFKDLHGVSGATVLSEGRIGLVLDIDELVAYSQGQGPSYQDSASTRRDYGNHTA